jgi:hypothetical protein
MEPPSASASQVSIRLRSTEKSMPSISRGTFGSCRNSNTNRVIMFFKNNDAIQAAQQNRLLLLLLLLKDREGAGLGGPARNTWDRRRAGSHLKPERRRHDLLHQRARDDIAASLCSSGCVE